MSPAAPPKTRASATGQSFGDCFDEHVVQRGYDDAKSAFASLRTCRRIGSGQQCANSGREQMQHHRGLFDHLVG
jgi:hypothetical protein